MATSSQLVGQTISHYCIVEQIGAGGMGVVYRAHDEQLDRDVALKVLPEGSLADDSARRRFRREALALAKLNHPNIETVYEFASEREIDVLITEYIAGITLDAKVSLGGITENEILELGMQLAEGIAAAHQQGVVHRDLKPANLRVTSDGRLKILDFGLARLTPRDAGMARTATLIESQEITGTLPYMAPEQLRGERTDPRSDIWAAGGVLYEMATGEKPFREELATALVNDIINKPVTTPAQINPKLSPKLADIILKCLEKDPENRYQTGKDLAIDLRRLRTLSTSPEIGTHSTVRRLPSWLRLGLVCAIMTTLVVGLYTARTNRMVTSPTEDKVMLAVLPFDNLSGDLDQEYIGDGLTEEMITQLGSMNPERLGVIARVSAMQYKQPRKSISQIGKELGVGYIVGGGVRRLGNRLRITVQLIRVRDQTDLWSHSYDGEMSNYLEVQRDIAEHVLEEIRVKLAPSQRIVPKPVIPDAYEAYLKGRYYLANRTDEGLRKSVEFFREAIEKQPDYGVAYAGLGDAYQLLEKVDDARVAVEKALQLDDQLAEAHNSLARLLYRVQRDWVAAEKEFKRALELDPNYATAHHWYSIYLGLSNRKQESLIEAQKAYQLDPMSPIIRVHLADTLQAVGESKKALDLLRETIEIRPEFPTAHNELGGIYEEKGMVPEAIVEYQKALELGGQPQELRGFLGYLYARSGNRIAAEKLLGTLKTDWPKNTHGALDIARVYSGLGNREKALYWLQKANEAKVSDLSGLARDTHFTQLHGDPRFDKVVVQVGNLIR